MKIIKPIIYAFISVITTIGVYFIVAYLFMLFPSKGNTPTQKSNHTIYLLYNEMHSDIVINLQTSNHNWQTLLPEIVQQHTKGYLAFGWGDKETYLNTPSWNDLKLLTALKALFIPTPSLMHVSYYPKIEGFQNVKTIPINHQQYQQIEQSLLKSFDTNFTYHHKGYNHHDGFYNALNHYHLINTCNTWTGDTLREANISMSYWTPLSVNVIDTLP